MFSYKAVKKSRVKQIKWYSFLLKDGPALLWDDSIFLSGIKGSPILLLNSIVRGSKTLGYYEGDKVVDKTSKEVLGVIVYCNGFYMQKNRDDIRKEIPLGHIQVCKGDNESLQVLHELERTPVSFKHFDIYFNFSDIITTQGETLEIMLFNKVRKINLLDVHELIYFNEVTGYKCYEGDVINGVVMTINNIFIIQESNNTIRGDVKDE